MNVGLWLKQAKNRIDSLDAELILLSLLRENDRSFLVAHDDMELSQNDLDVLEKLISLRERGAPVAYILGKKEFYGREFGVDRNVLIPRPESEKIIDIAKEILSKEFPEGVKILDVGTGSGCLAVTLALELKNANVVACDVSDEALKIASENALKLNARVAFCRSDLLDRFGDEKFDAIVANLPYVDDKWDFLSSELEWEPEMALYAADGGLAIVKELLEQVAQKKSAKYIILETDTSQVNRLKEFGKKLGMNFVKNEGFVTVFEVK